MLIKVMFYKNKIHRRTQYIKYLKNIEKEVQDRSQSNFKSFFIKFNEKS